MSRRLGPLPFVYERVFVSALPRIRGYFGMRFLRSIYRNLVCGSGGRCWGVPLIVMGSESSITLGRRVWLVSDRKRAGIALYSACKLRTMAGAEIVIGDDVWLNGTCITCLKRIEIGSGTLIAANVIVIDADFHEQWPPEARWLKADEGRPVVIGRNAWIGMGAMILKGSVIGDNSIIGAGSVVTGAIPDNVVAAGNPARVVRRLGATELGDDRRGLT